MSGAQLVGVYGLAFVAAVLMGHVGGKKGWGFTIAGALLVATLTGMAIP